MTDGPFKNLKLDSRLKRFAEAAQNQNVDLDICSALASNAIVHDILNQSGELIHALVSYTQGNQLALDPQVSIKLLCDKFPKSQFGDLLEREVLFRVGNGASPKDAIEEGLQAATETKIGQTKTRAYEACLEAVHKGEMRKEQLDSFVGGCDKAMKRINHQRINEALHLGKKNAFKQDIKKKDGLDEGPEL